MALKVYFLIKFKFKLDVILLAKHSNLFEKYINTEFKGQIKVDLNFIDENLSIIDSLKEVWNKINRDFIVMTGDIISDADLDDLIKKHIMSNATISILF